MKFNADLLEPESDFVPSFQKRAEDCYLALQDILRKGRLEQHTFHLDKVQIEALMGLLSHRFEGVW